MYRQKKEIRMSEETQNIIGQLIEMYGVKTAAAIQESLKDSLSRTIQEANVERDRRRARIHEQLERVRTKDAAVEYG